MSVGNRHEVAALITAARSGARLAIAALAVLAAAGTVAAAGAALNLFSAASGIQVHAGDPNARATGTGEAIAMGAYNDVSVGVKLTRDIPFAPGYESWRARTVAFETYLGPGSPPAGKAFITSSALRWQVAQSAVCSWLNYYLASKAAGETAGASRAAAQLTAAPHWPAITGLSYPDQLEAVVAAVRAGDPKLVHALIDTGQAGNCSALGPFPPTGMSIAKSRARLAAENRLGQQEIASDPIAQKLGITATPGITPPHTG